MFVNFALNPSAIAFGKIDQAAQAVQRIGHVADLLGQQNHAVGLVIDRQWRAETVENASTRWRYQAQVDAVFLGHRVVIFAAHDLQVIEPAGQHGKQRGLRRANQESAATKDSGFFVIASHRITRRWAWRVARGS